MNTVTENPIKPLTEKQTQFHAELTRQYERLFKDPDYAFSASTCTSSGLADKMTRAFISGSANKDGNGVKFACKAIGIPYTYKAISAFLAS